MGAGPSGATAARRLASKGRSVLLLDKAHFPRKKTCAGLLNARIFERFEYLAPFRAQVVQNPFYGVTFFNPDLTRRVDYPDIIGEPVGYLTKRLIFDDLLRRLAEEAGAKAKYGLELEGLKASHDEVVASFSDGSSATSSFLIGADGVRTAVGRLSGLNPGWPSSKVVVCLNEDASWPTEKITSFYGERRSVLVVPGYSFISGYAWVFPKADEIAIGIGGRASSTSGIGETFRRFVADAKKGGLLPEEIDTDDPETALDPAGAAYDFHQTAHGRILLVGDAAGFVSGHTGEGIFLGMCGAEIAADAVSVTLDGQQLESLPTRYEKAWRKEIGDFMRSPDPAEMLLVGLMFSNKSLVNRVARTFLTGKRVT